MYLTLQDAIAAATLCDFPRALLREDYAHTMDRYLALVRRAGDVKSVYQIGSVSSPGLSDIDLIVVLGKGARDHAGRYTRRLLCEKDRYIVCHDAWFMDETTFQMIPHLIFYQGLQKVFGKDIETGTLTHEDQTLPLILLVNCLIAKIPRELLWYSCVRGEFRIRTVENIVHSMTHTIELWRVAVGGEEEVAFRQFVEDYRNFRSAWESIDTGRLVKLLKEFVIRAIDIASTMITRANLVILREWFTNVPDLPLIELRLGEGRKRFIFKNEWSAEEFISVSLNSKGQMSLYPIGFGLFIGLYGSVPGVLGRYIREEIEPLERHQTRNESTILTCLGGANVSTCSLCLVPFVEVVETS